MSESRIPVVKTIARIERLRLSANGNPRFEITFTDYSRAKTQSDAAIGYEIGNPGYREDCRVAVTFTRNGRISYMSTLEDV